MLLKKLQGCSNDDEYDVRYVFTFSTMNYSPAYLANDVICTARIRSSLTLATITTLPFSSFLNRTLNDTSGSQDDGMTSREV